MGGKRGNKSKFKWVHVIDLTLYFFRLKIMLAAVIFLYTVSNAQKNTVDFYDSISSGYKNYYTLGNLQVSENGRYAAVKKLYTTGRDTTMIFDRAKPGKPIRQLIRKNRHFSFLPNGRIFTLGNGEAEILDLNSGKDIKWSGVSDVAVLEATGHYMILSDDRILKIYDRKDREAGRVEKVKTFFSDKKKNIFALTENGKNKEITAFSNGLLKKIYSTDLEIGRVFLSESFRHLIITEIRPDQEIKLTFMDADTYSLSSFNVGSSENLITVRVWESGDAGSYLVDVQKKAVEEKTVPEVWYADDGNLKAKKEKTAVKHTYYNWITGSRKLEEIPDDRFPVFAPTNNAQYLMAFDPYTNYRYNTRFPVLDIYLYDIGNHQYTKIIENGEDIMVSKNGKYLLNLDFKTREWTGKEIAGKRIFKIPRHLTSRPIFDSSGKAVWFESSDGLWKFDLENEISQLVKGTEGFQTSLHGYARKQITDQGNIHSYYTESNSSNFLKLRDDENRSFWMLYTDKGFKKVTSLTPDNITELKISSDQKYVFSVEENYNLPSRLVFNRMRTENKLKKVLDAGNLRDKQAKQIRQEMISYKDSYGTPLKGTLYYPTGFQDNRKYPMIVHIYMTQRTLSNEYSFPNASPIGFDLRTLLDRGYFIYLPDIVHSGLGSGMSAFDCVDHALDALDGFKNIDFANIGLTGHSMGGFETNFIATKSKRFKAYIAGSAHADIIRSYFSYHYDTGTPLMWQYENGQHSMNASFAENKDLYFRNNPIHNVENVTAPMLLWTGKNDRNVFWDHTMEFYLGLMRNGKQAIALFYPEGAHVLGKDTGEGRDLNRRSIEWWDYHLKGKTNIPWISKHIKKDAD